MEPALQGVLREFLERRKASDGGKSWRWSKFMEELMADSPEVREAEGGGEGAAAEGGHEGGGGLQPSADPSDADSE